MAVFKVAVVMSLDVVVDIEAENPEAAEEKAKSDVKALGERIGARFPFAEVSLVDVAVLARDLLPKAPEP